MVPPNSEAFGPRQMGTLARRSTPRDVRFGHTKSPGCETRCVASDSIGLRMNDLPIALFKPHERPKGRSRSFFALCQGLS
jgi:hypothetical protein